MNTQTGDLFSMLLIKRRDPFSPPLPLALAPLFPAGRKDGMRLAVPIEQWPPFHRPRTGTQDAGQTDSNTLPGVH